VVSIYHTGSIVIAFDCEQDSEFGTNEAIAYCVVVNKCVPGGYMMDKHVVSSVANTRFVISRSKSLQSS
jgi:hypothetical protein